MHAQIAQSESPARSPVRDELVLHEADASTRGQYIQFISRRFAEVYGARLYHFMPRLFGLHGASGRLIAAFGLNDAASGSLFVQHYFDGPVEARVNAQVGHTVRAASLAEIGNLAGATPGALRQLIPVLTRHLHEQDYKWLLFTGSSRLRNGFKRLGLPLEYLAPASAQRLPECERTLWGSYYQHSPAVMLGDIRGGYRYLKQLEQSPAGLTVALDAVAKVGLP